ncbi:hypothetical protein Sango_2760000 [Sesamum angolense]|uniref:Reverse transcriptase domain-containing protein n=1 Tax=Sesamum angolense TaxID=2727404 RepID=A0AAE1T8I1_9LAMI|nr:hypothetical protein Sango_2760000 [Sesamum angolense]
MIRAFQSKVGTLTSDRKEIQDIILKHFNLIDRSINPDLSVMEEILDTITPRVTRNMNEVLMQPFSPEKVKHALDQMCHYKSPGLDDNVLVAYELNHYLAHKRWGSVDHVALKLNISKAYDRVEWIFLERVLLRLGFHCVFVKLILICVSSVSYSIMLEGEPFGFIRPERGLHQVDPLSPYLFLFCVEAFSCMVQKEEHEGSIQGVAVCRRAPRLSHLLFADDTLLFYQATLEAIDCIKGILTKFERASDLKINLQKSAMVFSKNTDHNLKEALARRLGVELLDKHEKYMGLPTVSGCSKRELFVSLKNRVWSKLQIWGAMRLSEAGWMVLIKAVAQAIPTYAMGCFLLPDGLLHELDSMLANFFWQHDER